jgi:hypothetical protein
MNPPAIVPQEIAVRRGIRVTLRAASSLMSVVWENRVWNLDRRLLRLVRSAQGQFWLRSGWAAGGGAAGRSGVPAWAGHQRAFLDGERLDALGPWLGGWR